MFIYKFKNETKIHMGCERGKMEVQKILSNFGMLEWHPHYIPT